MGSHCQHTCIRTNIINHRSSNSSFGFSTTHDEHRYWISVRVFVPFRSWCYSWGHPDTGAPKWNSWTLCTRIICLHVHFKSSRLNSIVYLFLLITVDNTRAFYVYCFLIYTSTKTQSSIDLFVSYYIRIFLQNLISSMSSKGSNGTSWSARTNLFWLDKQISWKLCMCFAKWGKNKLKPVMPQVLNCQELWKQCHASST